MTEFLANNSGANSSNALGFAFKVMVTSSATKYEPVRRCPQRHKPMRNKPLERDRNPINLGSNNLGLPKRHFVSFNPHKRSLCILSNLA